MQSQEGHLVSPDEMFRNAKQQMLDGREPIDDEDWMRVVNFVAANLASGYEEIGCKIFRWMYQIPLPTDEVCAIARFQANRKKVN